MIGIYKITNKINGEVYIGQSIDIKRRWKTHITTSYNEKLKDYDSAIHRAIRKYGKENFEFSVLEETKLDKKLLNEREIYWIKTYNSYGKGYNETPGGEIGNMNHDEKHSRAKMSREEVIAIRTRYNNGEQLSVVYEDYKDKIHKTGFAKIWKGETWKDVMPEVLTEKNKTLHSRQCANVGHKNGRAILNEADVKAIRQRYKNGESIADIYKDYSSKGITYGSFRNTASGHNWKNIS
jgi:group I intron endonuclease